MPEENLWRVQLKIPSTELIRAQMVLKLTNKLKMVEIETDSRITIDV